MKSRDAALRSFDSAADATTVDEAAADELFAVVDLLEVQPPLRRALSDPSAGAVDRRALAGRVFGGRISATALAIVTEASGQPWPGGHTMIEAIERQGVRGLLRVAREQGVLERVQEELHQFATIIEGNPELADALRNRGRSLTDRRALIARLIGGKTSPITERLASRAAAARARTVPLTLASYLGLSAELESEQIAHVTVARPLDDTRLARLRRALEAQVGGKVFLQIEVDPEVLGGMNVALGPEVFESTVAGRLNEARRLLN